MSNKKRKREIRDRKRKIWAARNLLPPEPLETRLAFANMVSAFMDGSVLTILGDVEDNVVTVTQLSNGKVTVTGSQGTAVGGAGPFVNVGGIRAVLGQGDDELKIVNLRAGGEASIDGGGNFDSISLNNVRIPKLNVLGGKGDDKITVTNSYIDRVNIQGGRGNNKVEVRGSEITNLIVKTGDGNDLIQIYDSRIDRAEVRTDAGQDTLDVTRVRGRSKAALENFFAGLGDDKDTLYVNSVVADYFEANGGAGVDKAFTSNNQIPKFKLFDFANIT